MKQQQFRGFFKFILVFASLLIAATITLFVMGKTGIWSFVTTLATNVLLLVLAVMNLRRGSDE